MIKNIVFDFGGVLVEYSFRNFFAKMLGSEEKADWFLANVFTEEMNSKLDKQMKSVEEYIEEWKATWPELSDKFDYFNANYTDVFTAEVPGMLDLILQLKAQGYRLLGLSNWSTKVHEVMDKFPAIFQPLEGYLISYMVHQLKPSPEIFHSFLNKFEVKPEECVFIDDKPENIEGAKRVGMHGIVFENAEQLAEELRKILAAS